MLFTIQHFNYFKGCHFGSAVISGSLGHYFFWNCTDKMHSIATWLLTHVTYVPLVMEPSFPRAIKKCDWLLLILLYFPMAYPFTSRLPMHNIDPCQPCFFSNASILLQDVKVIATCKWPLSHLFLLKWRLHRPDMSAILTCKWPLSPLFLLQMCRTNRSQKRGRVAKKGCCMKDGD